jgi:hypothetical protein
MKSEKKPESFALHQGHRGILSRLEEKKKNGESARNVSP